MNNNSTPTPSAIKLPQSLLTELGVEGEFHSENGIRKRHSLTRKEKRKQERESKKRKISQVKTKAKNNSNHQNEPNNDRKPSKHNKGYKETSEQAFSALKATKHGAGTGSKGKSHSGPDSRPDSEEPRTAEDVFAALKRAKNAKKNPNQNNNKVQNQTSQKKSVHFEGLSEDDSSDYDLDDFDEDFDSTNSNNDGSDAEEMTEEDTWAALKALKMKKSTGIEKNGKVSDKKSKSKNDSDDSKTKRNSRAPIDPMLAYQLKEDEAEIAYYSRKLGLKGKKDRLSSEDDGLDDLLEGLDFNTVESGSENDSEDEFDDDISGGEDSDLSGELAEGSKDLADMRKPKVRENIYTAPTTSTTASQETGKYIPPSRRARMLEDSQESEEMTRLRRQIKGLLNRVSDSNIAGIVNELAALYNSNHSRSQLNSIITDTIIDSIALQGTLLESFLIIHATVATALYRVVGVEFGAYFVQTVTERFEKYYNEQQKTASSRPAGSTLSKETINVLALITEIYALQLVSFKLIYDLIKLFLTELSEMNTELLLHIMRNAGAQLRTDDPASLRDIIYLLQDSVAKHKKEVGQIGSRTQFLIDTISDLKNNKHKKANENTITISQRMKKFLGSYGKGDPLQVTLDDLHNVETRGKWWLVGAAWKNDDESFSNKESSNSKTGSKSANGNNDDEEDIGTEHNWMDLARKQRMNTDVRRAIFVAIMSSDDYMDAYERLQRLSLKHKQEQDIPFIVLHCCANEAVYNPFYSLVAHKLCAQHHLKKGFQFCLWDYLNDLEESPNSDLVSKQKTMHFAKFYGGLVAKGAMSLDILKPINFFTATLDTQVFSELFFVTLFNSLAKSAEKAARLKMGYNAETSRDPKDLVKLLSDTKNKTTLRGIEYFQEQVLKSDWAENEKQRKRLEWGVGIVKDIVPEILERAAAEDDDE